VPKKPETFHFQLSTPYAGVVELADSTDLGRVTSVKVFALSLAAVILDKDRFACFYKCGSSVTLRLGPLAV